MMVIEDTDFDDVYLAHSEVFVRLYDGTWLGSLSGYYASSENRIPEYPIKIAERMCGSVFILTDRGENEVVRLRQCLPHLNFIHPQLRFSPHPGEPRYTTPYERAANRPSPFKMVMSHVSDEFREFIRPYLVADDPRLMWMNDDVFMLLKLRF